MVDILQNALPDDMQEVRSLPGVQPVTGAWVRVDDAYAGQMALRRALLRDQLEAVCRVAPQAEAACSEVLSVVLDQLPQLGFQRQGGKVTCPDGVTVSLDGAPLTVLGKLIQSDICVLQKHRDEHVLTGACLCFPASWHLDDKFGKPMTQIHAPVDQYDAQIASRVQRLFDGVQAGRPLWRFNRLTYADAALRQPRRETEPRRTPAPGDPTFVRSERQSIVRLPVSRAVVFAIHTYVVRG